MKYNVLIIGAGKIGALYDQPKSKKYLSHAHAFRDHPSFNLVGFVDNDSNSLRKAVDLWGGDKFSSIDEAFLKHKVDVVIISTPNVTHYSIFKQIVIKPIKTIVIEKPFANNLYQARNIIKLASKYKISVFINFKRRFVPEFTQIASKIKNGDYGDFLTGSVYYGKGFVNNGSHFLDLISWFFNDVKLINKLSNITDYSTNDPSYSGLLKINGKQNIFFIPVDSNHYTVFELDLFFTKTRIKIINSGEDINEYQVKNSKVFTGYKNLYLANNIKTSLNRSLYQLAEDIYQHLRYQKNIPCGPVDALKSQKLLVNANEPILIEKKAFIYSSDPGGANVVAPLITPLQNKGYKICLYGNAQALSKYREYNFTNNNIIQKLNGKLDLYIRKLLVKNHPSVIITGTSTDSRIEQCLWAQAKKMNIPSIAILDQWMNYRPRFSSYNNSPNQQKSVNVSPLCQPNYILVMDNWAKKEMVSQGFDKKKLIITGQPHLETVMLIKNNPKRNKSLKKKLGISTTDFIIVFASEPIMQVYDNNREDKMYLGYNQYTIVKELISALSNLASKKNIKPVTLLIKLHPKENINLYKNKIYSVAPKNVTIKIIKDIKTKDIILLSDVVTGMSSIFLLEAALLKKPIISIQIGLKKENPFILCRKGELRSIYTSKELVKVLQEAIIKQRYLPPKMSVIKKPIANIINFIDSLHEQTSN